MRVGGGKLLGAGDGFIFEEGGGEFRRGEQGDLPTIPGRKLMGSRFQRVQLPHEGGVVCALIQIA